MKGWFAIYYREILILRRRFPRLLASMSVSPLLYLVAFGYAIGGHGFDGHSYLEFLVPGLVAMSSMTQAFAMGSEINIARFYWHIFEEFQAAPISPAAYVFGEVLAGVTRALLATGVILILGLLFGVRLHCGPWFWLGTALNATVFAALAVGLAMVVRSHADQALLTNFVITPMAFLGGTFFPVDRLPFWAQKALSILPLTHAARTIRSAALQEIPVPSSLYLLAALGLLFFVNALYCVNRARD